MYRQVGVQDRNRPAEVDPLEHAQPVLFRFLENKMWIDELYDRTVIAFALDERALSDWMDRYFWDGLVRLSGVSVSFSAIFTKGVDERGINAGVDETTIGARGLGRLMSALALGTNPNLSRRRSPSACWRCCFFTHGWFDHSAHSRPAGRRAFRERRRDKMMHAESRSSSICSPRSLRLTLWRNFDRRLLLAYRWSNVKRGFPRSALNISLVLTA